MVGQSVIGHTLHLATGLGLGFAFLAGSMSIGQASSVYLPPSVDLSCPTPSPKVPESATVNSEDGDVVLSILVNSSGRPRKVRVLKSSGFDDLDSAAVEAAATWRYHPALRDGSSATDWMMLDFQFKPVPFDHRHVITSVGPQSDILPVADREDNCAS